MACSSSVDSSNVSIEAQAGPQDLSTTQRYMHLSPAALESANRPLDGAGSVATSGGAVESAGLAIAT